MSKNNKFNLTEDEWQSRLSAEEYSILRKKGTEPAFSGKYWDHKGNGLYSCRGCGQPLFHSDSKYDSKSGWPSFFKPYESGSVSEQEDTSHDMVRTEILCSKCQSHIGHVFDDGPKPTGKRYCLNSLALKFKRD